MCAEGIEIPEVSDSTSSVLVEALPSFVITSVNDTVDTLALVATKSVD